jgi:hypothetical protein
LTFCPSKVISRTPGIDHAPRFGEDLGHGRETSAPRV